MESIQFHSGNNIKKEEREKVKGSEVRNGIKPLVP